MPHAVPPQLLPGPLHAALRLSLHLGRVPGGEARGQGGEGAGGHGGPPGGREEGGGGGLGAVCVVVCLFVWLVGWLVGEEGMKEEVSRLNFNGGGGGGGGRSNRIIYIHSARTHIHT